VPRVGGGLVEEADLPGRQGRLVLAYLVVERHRPVSREELATVLWPQERPASWNAAIGATVSKLRTLFSTLGYAGVDVVVQTLGAYQLQLPKETLIDVHTAAQSLEKARAAMRKGELSQAWSAAVGKEQGVGVGDNYAGRVPDPLRSAR
jgi:DNA-binding SARP family transcriptional activator